MNQESKNQFIHTIREKSKKKTPQMGTFLSDRLQLDSQVRYDNNIRQNNQLLEVDQFMRSVRSGSNDQELMNAKKVEQMRKQKSASTQNNTFGDIGCNMSSAHFNTPIASQKDTIKNNNNDFLCDRSFFMPNFQSPLDRKPK